MSASSAAFDRWCTGPVTTISVLPARVAAPRERRRDGSVKPSAGPFTRGLKAPFVEESPSAQESSLQAEQLTAYSAWVPDRRAAQYGTVSERSRASRIPGGVAFDRVRTPRYSAQN